MCSEPPGVSVLPVAVIESMCAGVSTPSFISAFARFARSIWPDVAPTPTLLVTACAPSAAFLTRSINPMAWLLRLRGGPARRSTLTGRRRRVTGGGHVAARFEAPGAPRPPHEDRLL